MRQVSVSAAALLLVGGAVAQVTDEITAPAPKSYIIEYSPASLRKRQAEISSTPGIEIKRTFESEIFNGVSVETEEFNLDTLNELPDVVRVWLNEEIPLAPIDIHSYAEDASAYNYTTHIATGVSKLHEQGIFGAGVRIGVVDTGIYYPHVALGEGLGEGFKVAGGYDFVGDGDWPNEPAQPDDDPLDYRGHGTHVAGIIAGKTEFWQGVAPEAELYGYKVFTNNPSTYTDILIASFIRAYEDGCDIITASIGGANGWSNNPWAEVASRLVDLGVVVTISAGNSGANGPFYGSSGSSGKNALAIASVETEDFPASPFELTFTEDGTSETITAGYLPSTFYFPPNVADWPVVALNLDTTIADDACTPFPSGTPSLEGKVALVRRGGCTFAAKQQNIEALGGRYLLIYNSDSTPLIVPGTDRLSSLIGGLSSDTGKAIIGALANGGEVTADFSPNPEEVVGIDYNVGGRPSLFTSWAGLYDLQAKPQIAAPGGNIFSAWSDGGYSTISGTSMACPYVAGVAALWISAHGGRSVHGNGFSKQLHQRIVASGKSVPWYDGTLADFGYPAAVAQVGNGLIDAWKVLHYDTRLEFPNIALNDTRYFNRYHEVTIFNDGETTVDYTWSVEHGAGIEAFTTSGVKRVKTFAQLRPLTLEAKVQLPRGFTLKAGESKKVSINFDNPDKLGWNAAGLPVFGGKVLLSGSNGERLAVPYYGVGADLRRQLTPMSEAGYPLAVSGPSNTPISQKSSFSFDLSVGAQDFPKIYSNLLWGSREIRFDVYEAGWRERQWSYPPVIGENGYVGTATGWSGATQFAIFDPAVHSPETLFTFPLTDTVRQVGSPTRYYWFGKLGNGTQIAEGKYHIRFAALKPFGKPEAADAWEVYRTPEITITGQY